jgi:uncharacterized protein YqgC (DUF456 family)
MGWLKRFEIESGAPHSPRQVPRHDCPMSPILEFLLFLVMGVGAIGVLLPVLPGLWLSILAALTWTWADGGGTRWWVFALQAAVFAIGTAASIMIPASTTRGPESRRTLTIAAVYATLGFFLIPVIGLPIGFGLGIFIASLTNGQTIAQATASTRIALRAYGTSVVVQLACCLGIAALYVVGLIIT